MIVPRAAAHARRRRSRRDGPRRGMRNGRRPRDATVAAVTRGRRSRAGEAHHEKDDTEDGHHLLHALVTRKYRAGIRL
jgi:hypothetical protein